MSALHDLADAVGLSRAWYDAAGGHHLVADEVLGVILDRLGYACADEAAIARSLGLRAAERAAAPALVTADAGAPLALPPALLGAGEALAVGEDGAEQRLAVGDGRLPGLAAPGYYRLAVAGREVALAVAPRRCFAPDDAFARVSERARRPWGAGVQIPALRGPAERPYGGLGELAQAARRLGALGADAVAISPTHALFQGIGAKFSPYTPSSRLFANVALADPALAGLPPLPARPGGALIDWGEALPRRLADLRAAFMALDDARRAEIAAWGAARGAELARHALFDALLCRFAPGGATGWRAWPEAFHDPHGAAAGAFAAANPDEIAFHVFTQWLADAGLAAAQAAARGGGMAIGLIADLAVGVDPAGSDAWSLGDAMFRGLGIGAPPDPLGPEGQNWALTSFSPIGLARHGFAPFIAMLRAALAHAGGLRVDHAFGLKRLWIVPSGRAATEGAYLAMPFDDLARLVALESHRARALVIAEDLGTMPDGFAGPIAERAMLGMRVLWFEREWGGGFRAPADYPRASVALTGTHDTPTVAGWWRGRDLGWDARLGRLPTLEARGAALADRARDRAALWRVAGAGAPQPADDDPAPAVAAALAYVGGAASELAIAPLEDLLALDEQPNIPGTVDEHPNWRRRLPAPLGAMLDDAATSARVAAFAGARGA